MVFSALCHDGSQERLNGNQRAASTIIMLCVITVVAVVFVHKESTADSLAETHPLMEGNWNEAEMESIELLQQREPWPRSRRPLRRKGSRRADEIATETVMLQSMPDNQDPADVVQDGHTYDPALNKTLSPRQTDLKTADVHAIEDVDTAVVAAAQKTAAEALKAGKDEATAYKEAQAVATKKVTSEAATRGDAPAFSRTIRAAAYAAQKRAEKLLQEGKSPAEVRKAAMDAAQIMVSDKRKVENAVPVRNTLARLLNQANNLWLQLETKLASLKAEVSDVPKDACWGEAIAVVNQSHHEMQVALIQASRHLHKSHTSKLAMDAHLAAAQAQESRAASLLQVDAVEKASRLKLAEDSKMQSALHHEAAKKQAMLAQGFLALASKHHDAASQAALKCKAKAILADYEYAERAKESYGELTAKRIKEATAKAAAEKSEKVNAKAKKEKKEKKKEKEAKELKAKKSHKSEKQIKAQERKEKGDAYPGDQRDKRFTEVAEKHLEYTKQMKQWIQAMQTNLPKQMEHAAQQALLATHGSKEVLSSAADRACSGAIKAAAKSLATEMKKVGPKDSTSKTALMKKAIITVLKVGRPLQPKIVSKVVQSFMAASMVATKEPSIKSKPSIKHALKLAVKNATAKAASEAQKRVAAAGGTAAQQLKAAAVAAATASKMAAKAFKQKAQISTKAHPRMLTTSKAERAKAAEMKKLKQKDLLADAKNMILGKPYA